MLRVCSPVNGIVPVFGVFAVGVQEDVFVNAPAEAEHVGGWMFTRLQHLQHHSEGLLPVPGTVPPAQTRAFKGNLANDAHRNTEKDSTC